MKKGYERNRNSLSDSHEKGKRKDDKSSSGTPYSMPI